MAYKLWIILSLELSWMWKIMNSILALPPGDFFVNSLFAISELTFLSQMGRCENKQATFSAYSVAIVSSNSFDSS